MPLPKAVTDLLNRADKLTDKAANSLTSGISRIERAAISKILAELADLSTGAGGFRITGANAAKLNRLRQTLDDILKTPGYIRKVNSYVRSFSQLETLTALKYNEMGIGAKKSMFKDIRQYTITRFESQLLGKGFTASVVDPLMDRINSLVMTGADFGHLESELSAFFDGSGGLERYTHTIAVDTINQFNGQINERIAKEFDLKWMVYTGSIIATSAGQCTKWVEKRYIHKSELAGEIAWVKRNKGRKTNGVGEIIPGKKGHRISAMIPGTTPSSFATLRGHHGCRHAVTYVSDELVPADRRKDFE